MTLKVLQNSWKLLLAFVVIFFAGLYLADFENAFTRLDPRGAQSSSHLPSKKILIWNQAWKNSVKDCTYHCLFTTNRTEISSSDAVVFSNTDINLPKRTSPKQIWVWSSYESPLRTSKNLTQLNDQINWTMSYRHDSDIRVYSTGRLPAGRPGQEINESVIRTKTGMAVWFTNSCKEASQQETFVKELTKVVNVDVYGRCAKYKCEPIMGHNCYQMAERKYFFYLSFEQSICKDYITEIFYLPLRYNIVPVVLGGGNYASVAPPQSYIDALNFPSPTALGTYLKYLIDNPDDYLKYMKWKEYYPVPEVEYPLCTLCKKLSNLSVGSTKTWTNLFIWFVKDAHCSNWTKVLNSKKT